MTTFADLTANVDRLPPGLRERVKQIAQRAQDAFWEVVTKEAPEAKSGDMDPLTSIEWDSRVEEMVRQWLSNNDPTFEQAFDLWCIVQHLVARRADWQPKVNSPYIELRIAPFRVARMQRHLTNREERWEGELLVLPNPTHLNTGGGMIAATERFVYAMPRREDVDQYEASADAVQRAVETWGY